MMFGGWIQGRGRPHVGWAALGVCIAACAACNPGEEGGSPEIRQEPGGGGDGAPGDAVPPEYLPGSDDELFGSLDDELPMTRPDTPAPLARRGLLTRQVTCADGATTSLSGTVYIPSGALPLYNAMVYVPDAELAPLTPGATCGCEVSGAPIVSTLTDAAGRFVLPNVPVGSDVPLVVQVGDWRREFTIPSVSSCVDNPIPDRTLRLPARQSEGDIPRMAVVTGSFDALECLIRKLGVDPAEFTPPDGGGRVHLYAGDGGARRYERELNDGAAFPLASELWSNFDSLSPYDVALFSCEGPDDGGNKGEAAFQAMFDYLNAGGRLFASHYQAIWFEQGPEPLSDVAEFVDGADLGELSANVVTSFPKGEAMASWLATTGNSAEAGQVAIRGAQHNIDNENPEYAQRWLATTEPDSVQYISANTPLSAPENEQCGRVVLSDIHVSPGGIEDDFSNESYPFPSGCITETLTPQEAVLAFMLFDISACVVPDDRAPTAPPIIR